ncbi:MAG: Na+:solute symporter [Bacteroidales bacterium]|nr:Na+:solute symporter [Bacteroidales bacterium]
MKLEIIDWILIVLYIIISLAIGLKYKNRAGKSLSDFFLGGRKLPWYIAGISMVATTFAADTPLAVTELVAQNGISGNWIWWNMLIGGMLTTFFFAKLWRRANVLTELEFIELRYSGKPAAFLRGFKAVYLGVFINTLIIGWVNIALISIFRVFFDIPENQIILFVALAMLIASVYSSLSGLLGVAVTDAVQFVIAMTGSVILAVIVINSEKIGGISGLKEKLPEWSLDFFPKLNNQQNSGNIASTLTISIGAFFAYIGVQWWASWYPGAEPGGGGYVAQRMMSTKNEKHSIWATLFFQITHYTIRPWPWILVGLAAIVIYPDLPLADKKLGYVMAIKDFLPAGLKGLLLIALLAAYMSTISTQLNWGASYIVNDLYKRFINTPKNSKAIADKEKHYVFVSRIVTILIMFVALYVTTLITSITQVWTFLLECGAGLGLVLILRWYWWRINAWSEITATIMPFILYGFSKFVLNYEFPQSFFITVGFTTVSWVIITYLTPHTSQVKLVEFYKRVQPQGVWGKISELSKTNTKQKNIFTLFVCWISSIVMTYSFLFMTGKILFKEWSEAFIWIFLCIISFIILFFSMKSINITKKI